MQTQATLAERDQRYARLRNEMEKAELDAMIIMGKGHGCAGRGYFRWFTDFHMWCHQAAILFPLEGEPMMSGQVGQRVADVGWITDFVPNYRVMPPLIAEIRRRGLDKSRFGIAGYERVMGTGFFDALREGLPDATLVDADTLMNRVRAIKSPLEIQQMREGWALSKAAMERFVNYLEPGMTERQASAEPVRFLHEHGARDYLIFVNGNIPGDRIVELEGILSYHMEILNQSGHWCELEVNLAFDSPSPLQLRLQEADLRAFEAVKKAAVPGVRLKGMFNTYQDSLRNDGWVFTEPRPLHNEFHGQGLDWVEWPIYSEPGMDTELEAGMVLNYHPSPNPGYFRDADPDEPLRKPGICDTIVITSDGAVSLSGDWDMRWRIMC